MLPNTMNRKQTLTPYPYSAKETFPKGINGTTSDPNEVWDRLEEEYRDPGTDVQKSDVELTDDLKNESTRIIYTNAELLKLYKEPTAKCPQILASLYGSAAAQHHRPCSQLPSRQAKVSPPNAMKMASCKDELSIERSRTADTELKLRAVTAVNPWQKKPVADVSARDPGMIIHQSAARAEDTVAQLIRELGEKDAALELLQKELDDLRKMISTAVAADVLDEKKIPLPQQNGKPGVVSNSPLNMSIASLASGGWSTVETKKQKSVSEANGKAVPAPMPKEQQSKPNVHDTKHKQKAIVTAKVVTKTTPKASFKISLIPNDRWGHVMGKQGSAMKEIQSRSGCKIHLHQAVCDGYNKVEISGPTVQQVAMAELLVQAAVEKGINGLVDADIINRAAENLGVSEEVRQAVLQSIPVVEAEALRPLMRLSAAAVDEPRRSDQTSTAGAAAAAAAASYFPSLDFNLTGRQTGPSLNPPQIKKPMVLTGKTSVARGVDIKMTTSQRPNYSLVERIEVDAGFAGKILGRGHCIIKDVQKRANCSLWKLKNVSLTAAIFECRANCKKDILLARLLVSVIIRNGPDAMNVPKQIEDAAKLLAKQHPSFSPTWEDVVEAAVAAIPDAAEGRQLVAIDGDAAFRLAKEKQERDAKEKEEKEALKEAAKAAKEQERLLQEAEAARLQAEKKLVEQQQREASKLMQEQALSVAAAVYATKLRGQALWDHISSLDAKVGRPSGAALLAEVLQQQGLTESAWWQPDEYGTVLKRLLNSSEAEEVKALQEVQLYCHSLGFPKDLLVKIFTALHSSRLVDKYSFVAWEDSEEDVDHGKCTALVQCTSFLALRKDEIQTEEEVEEEKEEGEAECGEQGGASEDGEIGVYRPYRR